jgi:hypothetical protein
MLKLAPGVYEQSIIATGPANLLHWQLFDVNINILILNCKSN